MDESTSAVDQDMEKTLYKLVHKYGVTTFSIGHRESLIDLHKFLLQVSFFFGLHVLFFLHFAGLFLVRLEQITEVTI